MDKQSIERIRAMAGKKTAAVDSTGLIRDLLKGAMENKRLAGVELGGALARGGFSPIEIAKTAGALLAMDEAGLSVKEACQATGLPEDTLQAIAAVTR